jgi:hypothetical protein
MGVTLLFKWKGSGLKVRRSDKEKQLKAEGWGSSLTDEEVEKLESAENKLGHQGFEKPLFIKGSALRKIK